MHDDQLDALIAAYGNDFSRLEQDLANRKRAFRKAHERRRDDMPVVLSAQDLTKTYKSGSNRIEAAKDVSFTVRAGEMVALTGPSGSGKSTVLNLISGLDRPDSGAVHINDVNVTKLSRNKMAAFRCQHIGFVFQFFYLQPFLDLTKNVGVPTMFLDQHRPTLSERNARATDLIASVDLSDRATHLPRELSGGQMQRAAIARALINRPKLLLADEPTGNLDSQNAQAIMDLFDRVRNELQTAVIVVTHDPKVASFADRVIEMQDGKVAS